MINITVSIADEKNLGPVLRYLAEKCGAYVTGYGFDALQAEAPKAEAEDERPVMIRAKKQMKTASKKTSSGFINKTGKPCKDNVFEIFQNAAGREVTLAEIRSALGDNFSVDSVNTSCSVLKRAGIISQTGKSTYKFNDVAQAA